MIRPTDDQITELEDIALSKSGSPDLLEIEIEEAGIVAIVRRLTTGEYRDYIDGVTKDETRVNARVQAMMRATLFPKRVDLNLAHQNFPGLPKRICDEGIDMLVGKPERENPEQWIPLAEAAASPDVLEECGLIKDVVAKLLAQYPHKGQLWICKVPSLDLVFVVKRPTVEAWNKLARDLGESFFGATLDLAADCCVYPETAAAELKAHPALAPLVFFAKLKDLAAGSSKSASKKFVRSAKRSAA